MIESVKASKDVARARELVKQYLEVTALTEECKGDPLLLAAVDLLDKALGFLTNT
jgi:hypothetical protein